MTNVLPTLVLLGTLQVTSYRSIPAQTDSTPHFTSVGWHTNPGVVAVSQDLLKSGQACYGDVLVIPEIGTRIVSDVMNERHTNSIDVWVATKPQEALIGTRKLKVYILRSPERKCNRKSFMESK